MIEESFPKRKRERFLFAVCGGRRDDRSRRQAHLIGRKVQDKGKRVVFPRRKLYKGIRGAGRTENGGTF